MLPPLAAAAPKSPALTASRRLAPSLARVILAAIVVGELFSRFDALDARHDPNLPLVPQQNAVRATPAVIDQRGAVALIEPIQVEAISQLHNGGRAFGNTLCRLLVVDQGALVLHDLDAPGNFRDGEDPAASNRRGLDQQWILGVELDRATPSLWPTRHGDVLATPPTRQADALTTPRPGFASGPQLFFPVISSHLSP